MIARDVCARVLQKAVSTGADYAEIFAENTINHSISMIADKVDAIRDTVIAGASVRVYKGLRSVMASTVDTSEAGLLACWMWITISSLPTPKAFSPRTVRSVPVWRSPL